MKKKLNKTTKSFKVIIVEKTILSALNWKGSALILPYWWNGRRVYARIKLSKLYKIIEWDIKKLPMGKLKYRFRNMK